MRHYDNLKGKHAQYGAIHGNYLVLGLTREQYLAEKASGNRDAFKGFDRWGIEHQAQCHNYAVYGPGDDANLIPVKKYIDKFGHTAPEA